jgi:hypothetical protein
MRKGDSDQYYSLKINQGNQFNSSWEFETNNEALKVYNLLRTEFVEYEIAQSPNLPIDKIVQVTIYKVYKGSVPNTMASFSPETWFDPKVYDQLISRAEKESNK